MKPPVDASKLSEAAKGGGRASSANRSSAWSRSAAPKTSRPTPRSGANCEKTVAAMKELNQAMGSQRFPARTAKRLGPDPVHAE